ncbi:MAG: hypothetical protein AAF411_31140, partial [Myxococcota bacterium]
LAMAEAFYALPVAETAEFVVMAMANPDDSHAITELERLLGASVEPRPARVSELKQALLRLRSTAPAEPEPIPLRAAAKAPQRQAAPAEPTPLATRASERDDPPSGTVALPLLRTKPADRTFARPSEDSWDATPIETPISSARPGDIGPVLAALRQAESRDHAVALACRGVTRIARLGVLLGLRRGVLRGWDGFGDGISQDAIRNLWIPTSSPSMFRDVVDQIQPYRGAYGASAADNLFRAAIGSRGGVVSLHPVTVTSQVVAVLCADEPSQPDDELVSVLAHAAGEALTRLARSE